jgi:GT2 family glycosyltransferase
MIIVGLGPCGGGTVLVTWLLHANGLTAPVAVAEIDLAEPFVVSVPAAAYAGDDHDSVRRALVLVRLHGKPIGTVLGDAPGGHLDATAFAEQAWAEIEPAISAHLEADGMAPGPEVTPLPEGTTPLCRRDLTPDDPVFVSVVVATRERPALLAVCLDSLSRLDYPDYEVLVVDNDPVTDDTAELVRGLADSRIRYVAEPRRGLAAAHNRGLAEATGSVVAFTDDDVIVDRYWLREITSAMRANADVACVTGLIMPAELATQPQLMLELHGHFGKGFDRRIVNLRDRRPSDPLFPFTVGKLGSGANMAFDRHRLARIGGFDPATGAGTVARGGDDLAALFAVLAAGHSISYEPGAIVWHRHRRDDGSLATQAYGYGVGLGAYLTSALVNHPRMIGRALRRAPTGLAYALRPDSPRNRFLGDTWPRELVRLERKGLMFGPFAYTASRWRARGASRALANGDLAC